jgi:hypothetical protein
MRQDSRTTLGSPNPAYMPPSGPMNIKRRGYTTNPEAKPSFGRERREADTIAKCGR